MVMRYFTRELVKRPIHCLPDSEKLTNFRIAGGNPIQCRPEGEELMNCMNAWGDHYCKGGKGQEICPGLESWQQILWIPDQNSWRAGPAQRIVIYDVKIEWCFFGTLYIKRRIGVHRVVYVTLGTKWLNLHTYIFALVANTHIRVMTWNNVGLIAE